MSLSSSFLEWVHLLSGSVIEDAAGSSGGCVFSESLFFSASVSAECLSVSMWVFNRLLLFLLNLCPSSVSTIKDLGPILVSTVAFLSQQSSHFLYCPLQKEVTCISVVLSYAIFCLCLSLFFLSVQFLFSCTFDICGSVVYNLRPMSNSSRDAPHSSSQDL